MAAKRGRTLSTFGQAFSPWGVSGGSAAPVPPPAPPAAEGQGGILVGRYGLTRRLSAEEWRRMLRRAPELDEMLREKLARQLLIEQDDLELLMLL